MYPPEALREAIANAICHRDYSIGGGSIAIGVYDDRLEVTSSGSLHFGLTPGALFAPHESLPWNPLIAGVFYRRGIIERWGRGTTRMAELADKAGLPRPEIEDAGGCVTVRFAPGGYMPPRTVQRSVSERQRAILSILHDASAGLALREIVRLLGNGDDDRRRVRRDLAQLRGLGLAVTTGHGRGARWWLAEGTLGTTIRRGSGTIEGINAIHEGTPESACRAGKASASQLIREHGQRGVALEYRDDHGRARMHAEALNSHGGHWDQEGDLAQAFLRCFDEELRRSLGCGP